MKCIICGEEFQPKAKAKYCPRCRKEHDRERSRIFVRKVRADPVQHAAYLEKQREHRISQPKFEDFFEPLPEEDERRRQLINQKLNLRANSSNTQPFCMWCGEDFEPKYRGEKYCSEECYEHSVLRRYLTRYPFTIKYFRKLIEVE